MVTDRYNEMFVSDFVPLRIKVYDKDGIYQRSITHEGSFNPGNITITPHQLFVCSIAIGLSCRILNLDKLSGNILSSDNYTGVSYK